MELTPAALKGTNPCPICLGPIVQESYLDKCFHKFCYDCIVQWTRVVSSKQSLSPSSVNCPLCNTENYSLIRGFDGTWFERRYVNQNFRDSFSFITKAHKYRLQCYCTEPAGILNAAAAFDVSSYWNSGKYLQSNQWLQSWLKREVQALTKVEDVDIIVHHLIGVFDSFVRRNEQKHVKTSGMIREEFKTLVSDAARPFILERTNRFVDEIELFLASGLSIEAYDGDYANNPSTRQ
ncbi:E3 ubiquitin-protein ligase Topors-like [Tripterygium wilfordii]|uniref:E3 ubiquitin-protein ligase Topors-like n=1 Tax=Tripterygium wilfordii TaxID=458696 RepID=UPI0018F803D6|nr:E3 ubiquitin-protein ligase Topors-like [Tripterygium wilfordii]